MGSLEKEIERLRRQSETLQLRKNLALKETKVEEKDDEALREEVEQYGGQLIHLDDYRMQAVKYRPHYFALDNMSFEDLESLIKTHEDKLKALKDLYPRGELPEEYKGLEYEEVSALRVTRASNANRRNTKLGCWNWRLSTIGGEE